MQENFDFATLGESNRANKVKKTVNGFIGNMGIIIAAMTLFCAAAVFFMDISLASFVTASFSLSFVVLLFCAYTIYFSLADTGMRAAMSDKSYIKAKEEYEALKSELRKSGRLEYLNDFCHQYVKNELVSAKKELLLSGGISYSDFCEKYSGKDKSALPRELGRKAKRAILSANRIKPIHLTPDMLLSVGRNVSERRALRKNPERTRFFSALRALIPTTVTSFFAVSIVCSVIQEPSSSVIIECLIKLFTLVWNGSKGFLMGYNNVALDTTAYLCDCSDILTRFSAYADKAEAIKQGPSEND